MTISIGSSTVTLSPRERIHPHHDPQQQQHQHVQLTIFDKLAGVDKRRASVLTGLEADRLLGESVSLWAKLVFLATNIPYWIVVTVIIWRKFPYHFSLWIDRRPSCNDRIIEPRDSHIGRTPRVRPIINLTSRS